jgi:hypothetical protein
VLYVVLFPTQPVLSAFRIAFRLRRKRMETPLCKIVG